MKQFKQAMYRLKGKSLIKETTLDIYHKFVRPEL